MATLRFWNQNPAGGWKFLQFQSRLVIEGESGDDLVDRVQQHRTHKGFTPTDKPSIRLEIERQICGRLGINECRPEGIEDEWVPVPADSDVMNLDKIMSFSEAAWAWLKTGGEIVPLPEAERRAAICRDCPANCDTGKDCFNCALGGLIRLAVPPDRRLPSLKICGHCSCDLQSKVNMPDSVIIASDKGRGIVFPIWCWQRAIIEAHKSLPKTE